MFATVIAAFYETAARRSEATCARFKKGGRWQDATWTESARRARDQAAFLCGKGVRHGDRVGIAGATSYEWTIADLGILSCGAVCVPIYASLTAVQMAHIISDSRPKIIFADRALFPKINEAVRLSGYGTEIAPLCLEGLPRTGEPGKIDAIVRDLEPRDEATIVYTSGTTGLQKGVVLTHGNLAAEVRGAREAFDFSENEVGLAFLPLAHVLGRMLQFYNLAQGCVTAYAEGIERLAENYIEIRPHFLCAVPRMLEKVYELVQAHVRGLPRPVRRLFNWAFEVGRERVALMQKHREIPFRLRAEAAVADLLVFRRIRARLGGRLRAYICGGAPLSEEIARFFCASGIMVLEGWGLTETFAAVTVNRTDDFHFGTVGKPLAGAELGLAPDGEVLVRGPLVFKEYLNLPEETRRSFTPDGWFMTGDIGEISRDGFLRITGRKKDIIITAGGKNVAPQVIEEMLSRSPYVNYAVLCGDGRKYLTAIFTLNAGAVIDYLAERGTAIVEGEALSRLPAVRQLIAEHVEEQNGKLASYETVKKFAIVDGDFTVDGGELTPTLKIRRNFAVEKHRDLIDSLYRDEAGR